MLWSAFKWYNFKIIYHDWWKYYINTNAYKIHSYVNKNIKILEE